ncbi:DNA repair protein RadC [Candidatus Parcubacteria bacterium]|nr:MAG: DNA repair protein RadC [Candidatus Parcubacteria bacterium]
METAVDNDLDLIARVIGKGKKTLRSYKISQKMLQYFKEPCTEKINYKKLASSSLKEFEKIDGVGKVTAEFLEVVIEFAKKLQSYREGDLPVICTPDDAAKLLMSEMRYYRQEVFKVLLLNTKNRLLRIETVSTGILDASLVSPREVFKPAVDHLASSLILIHNHPSGNISPSGQDIEITKNIVAAGKILNIDVIDHIIIGDGTYLSMKEKRFI